MAITFVKQGMLDRYTPVSGGQSNPESTHVIMTKADYSSLIHKHKTEIEEQRIKYEDKLKKKRREYDSLSEKYSNLSEKWNDLIEERENSVIISQEQYNGYKKALRIIKDRSLQQIDKSKADKYGYRLLRADKRFYDKDRRRYAYLITKSTPYSIKMDPQVVNDEILDDLKEYYRFIEKRSYMNSYGQKIRINLSKYCDGIEQKDDPQWADKGFYSSNDEEGEAIYEIFQKYNNVFIFDISKLSTNHSQGVYEITYWATGII